MIKMAVGERLFRRRNQGRRLDGQMRGNVTVALPRLAVTNGAVDIEAVLAARQDLRRHLPGQWIDQFF